MLTQMSSEAANTSKLSKSMELTLIFQSRLSKLWSTAPKPPFECLKTVGFNSPGFKTHSDSNDIDVLYIIKSCVTLTNKWSHNYTRDSVIFIFHVKYVNVFTFLTNIFSLNCFSCTSRMCLRNKSETFIWSIRWRIDK